MRRSTAIVAIVDRIPESPGHPRVARLLAEGPAVSAMPCAAQCEDHELWRCGGTACSPVLSRDGEPARSLVARRDGRSPRWRPGHLGPTLGAGAWHHCDMPGGRRQLIADDRRRSGSRPRATSGRHRGQVERILIDIRMSRGQRRRPFAVDLAADGPHVLVAETAGSGKSELLQTLIASLANSRPRPDGILTCRLRGRKRPATAAVYRIASVSSPISMST